MLQSHTSSSLNSIKASSSRRNDEIQIYLPRQGHKSLQLH